MLSLVNEVVIRQDCTLTISFLENLILLFEKSTIKIVCLQIVELDLTTVTPSLSGPKRPHDRVSVSEMKQDFMECLNNKVGFKGFGIPPEKHNVEVPFTFDGQEYKLSHGKNANQLLNAYYSSISDNSVPLLCPFPVLCHVDLSLHFSSRLCSDSCHHKLYKHQ